MIMAELGAQVIKVEQPIQGDETRGYEPFVILWRSIGQRNRLQSICDTRKANN
jgi:crotonobetainyl-CoA:carnitine CoA-transferase CaiB-like acyl-CoA transferase